MRPESNNRPSQHSTNGSQNGSSPITNGSSKGSSSAETNGFAANGHQPAGPADNSPFFGHDREEVTRLLLQSLNDLGYPSAAKQLSRDSGYELESPRVAAFRSAVTGGEWEQAEALLFGARESEDGGGVRIENGDDAREKSTRKRGNLTLAGQSGDKSGLPLAEGADTTWLKFLIRQQKYLEYLEDGDLNAALVVLRSELTPLRRDTQRLHELSSYIMAESATDLRKHANWDGAHGQSRNQLLSSLSRAISPSVMIPEHRIATLLNVVQQDQIRDCLYHNTQVQPSLYSHHECSPADFPLHTLTELRNHSDEVWYLDFSHDGSMLATGGKEGLVCIYDTVRWQPIHEFREHESGPANDRGVCYVAFSPDDHYLISCSKANEFVVVDVHSGRRVAVADHFDYPVTSAAWLPDSLHFVVGTQGSRRPLSLYGLHQNTPASAATSSTGVTRNNELFSWRAPPWSTALKDANPFSFRITDLAISPSGDRLAALTLDDRILVYDLRSRYRVAEWQMENKLTSITYSGDGRDLLVNMNEGRVLCLDAGTGEVRRRFEGAKQKQFVVRSCFGGADQGVVVSGSEDSRIYLWRRETGRRIAALDAHAPGPVNAVAWHPTNPAVFASAGDDRRVRIWTTANALHPPGSRRSDDGRGFMGVAPGPRGFY